MKPGNRQMIVSEKVLHPTGVLSLEDKRRNCFDPLLRKGVFILDYKRESKEGFMPIKTEYTDKIN